MQWRTLAVAATIYAGWLAVVLSHEVLPWPLAAAILGVLIAWHGSLQHETIHGHPFRHRWANVLLAAAPLNLRLPYHVYRRYHLLHHQCDNLDNLTDPIEDPESYYVSAERWAGMGKLQRAFVLAHHTLLGRIVLGPPVEIVRVLVQQARLIISGDRALARWWAWHAVAVTGLIILVAGVVGMPLWVYLLGVYLAHSLTLIRSYCEHCWTEGEATRSAVVSAGPFFSLLFLNNNLHHVHHAEPSVAWYKLPARTVATDAVTIAAQGAGAYHGYLDVARRYLVRPYTWPVHPQKPDDADRPARSLPDTT